MPVQIVLPDEALKHLNQKAEEELRKVVARYAEDALREAGRLEATGRTAAGSPEITSSMVNDADLLLRRGYARPRRGFWARAAQVVAPVAAVPVGLLADMEKLKNPAALVAFVVLLTLSIATTVVVVMKD